MCSEDNLKLRQALPETVGLATVERLCELAGSVECELPNEDLYAFKGSLHLSGGGSASPSAAAAGSDAGSDKPIPVDIANVIWRGSSLQNTAEAYGLVVYTGAQSKLIMNSRPAPAKRSGVERAVDRAILLIFLTLAVMCTVSTLLHKYFLHTRLHPEAWYLPFLQSLSTLDQTLIWITFLILYNNLVPISLYVSLEVVKLVQAKLVSADLKMYYAPTATAALARTSNLNENLGQVWPRFPCRACTHERPCVDLPVRTFLRPRRWSTSSLTRPVR